MKANTLPTALGTIDSDTSEASESENDLFFDELTNFVINDFIKRHIFSSFKSFSSHKNNPSVTADDDEEIESIYDGPRLPEGCSEFDKFVSTNYPLIKTEMENITNIDAATYGVCTMAILQKIMREGKDIIFLKVKTVLCSLMMFISRQHKIHHLQHKLSRIEVLHQW